MKIIAVDYSNCGKVTNCELIGPEVPHFSSNGDKYIVGLLFIVNIS